MFFKNNVIASEFQVESKQNRTRPRNGTPESHPSKDISLIFGTCTPQNTTQLKTKSIHHDLQSFPKAFWGHRFPTKSLKHQKIIKSIKKSKF